MNGPRSEDAEARVMSAAYAYALALLGVAFEDGAMVHYAASDKTSLTESTSRNLLSECGRLATCALADRACIGDPS